VPYDPEKRLRKQQLMRKLEQEREIRGWRNLFYLLMIEGRPGETRCQLPPTISPGEKARESFRLIRCRGGDGGLNGKGASIKEAGEPRIGVCGLVDLGVGKWGMEPQDSRFRDIGHLGGLGNVRKNEGGQ